MNEPQSEDRYHDNLSLGATARLQSLLRELEENAHSVGAEESVPTSPAKERPEEGDTHQTQQEEEGLTARFGDLIDGLDERAYGMMLLLLALPVCLPFVYILPQLVSLPMIALAAQLALGRPSPWLPRRLRQREFPIRSMQSTVSRAAKYMGFFERLARPRLTGLSDGVGGRVVGALMIIPIASIMVPLPLTNTTPGIGVAIAALGLIERDGLLILLGLMIGLVWVFLLLFFGAEAIHLAKEWLLAHI